MKNNQQLTRLDRIHPQGEPILILEKLQPELLHYSAFEQYKGADKYLLNLFKEGKLNDTYELRAYEMLEPVKGKFSITKDGVLTFAKGDLCDFRHDSIVKLAIALGYVL
jgi:hypothetical protein